MNSTLSGAYHRNCRCPRCYEGHATWVRERRHALADGTWQPWTCDLQPALDHLQHLHDSGLTWTHIARLAGVHRSQVSKIRTSREFVRPALVAQLLAVQPTFARLPAGAPVPAEGTRRRIQALRAIGWTSQAIAAIAGLSVRTLNKVLADGNALAGTVKRLAELYDDLHDQDPAQYGISAVTIERGIRYAKRRHWAMPTGWTDIDTDTKPNLRLRTPYYAKPKPGDRGQSVIDDTAELAALGLTRAVIAERVGIAWNSIEVTHVRAGVALPVQLRQEHASESAVAA
jgi:transcriptional regulator with XRE-family HTH domain